jgi:tetratricopeptide (TPR) repeat protein
VADQGAPRELALQQLAAGDFAAALPSLAALATRHPDDPLLAFAHAEALWGAGDAAAALPHFEAALAREPTRLRLRARYGLALIAAGRPTEALAPLEIVVAALPRDTTITAMAAPFGAPLAFAPAAADAALQLGQVLLATGAIDLAIAALRHAAALDPAAPLPHLFLGVALTNRGAHADALDVFRTAVLLDPDAPLGWVALADLADRLGHRREAASYAQAARSLRDDAPAETRAGRDMLVGNALLAAGATDAAHARFVRSMATASWAQGAAPAAHEQLRVGVLAATSHSNTPFDFILDRTVHAFEVILMLDGFAYPHARIAASYDVLFNAVADADMGATAAVLARDLIARTGLPVVNHPDTILATTRERVAARLAGIDGCLAPPTGRYAAAALAAPDGVAQALAEIGLPMLVRPAGSHGGTGIARIDSADTLTAHLAWPDADTLYLTRYCDFRSADGHYRKYRLIFVDGEILPYHLAIGDDWLVHYVGTPMAEDAALRAEEAAFLADWRGHLGARAATALERIAAAMALDYAGIDCALLPDGRLLLFECNAAMLVRHVDQPAMFDYKRAPAERIRAAVSRLLARRAGTS